MKLVRLYTERSVLWWEDEGRITLQFLDGQETVYLNCRNAVSARHIFDRFKKGELTMKEARTLAIKSYTIIV